MTTIDEFIDDLHRHGISIWVAEGRQLGYKAPIGALTDSQKARLRDHREQIVARLLDRPSHRAAPQLTARASKNELEPLSFAQKAFVAYYDQLKDASLQTTWSAIGLAGSLDSEILLKCFRILLMRHPVLRARYRIDGDGQLGMSINDTPELDFQFHKFQGVTSDISFRETSDIIASAVSQRFNLSNGPLVRVRLVTLAEDNHALLVAIHHSVFDAWSFGILAEELQTCYAALMRASSPTLPPLAIQYADYTEWLEQWIGSDIGEIHIAYWRAAFQGAVSPFRLPSCYDFGLTHVGPSCGYGFDLDRTRLDELRSLARFARVTLYVVLLTAVSIALARWRATSDVFVKVLHHGRHLMELNRVIGCFTDCAILRINLWGSITFNDALTRVREVHANAGSHLQVPYWIIRQELARASDDSQLLDIHFNFTSAQIFNVPGTRIEVGSRPALAFSPLPQTAISPPEMGSPDTLEESSGILLKINVLESDARVSCSIRYVGSRIEADTVKAFSQTVFEVLSDAGRSRGAAPLDQWRRLSDERDSDTQS